MVTNLIKAADTVENHSMKKDMGEFVDKMTDFPSWPDKPLLSLPSEYDVSDNASDVLASGLDMISSDVRSMATSVSTFTDIQVANTLSH